MLLLLKFSQGRWVLPHELQNRPPVFPWTFHLTASLMSAMPVTEDPPGNPKRAVRLHNPQPGSLSGIYDCMRGWENALILQPVLQAPIHIIYYNYPVSRAVILQDLSLTLKMWARFDWEHPQTQVY